MDPIFLKQKNIRKIRVFFILGNMSVLNKVKTTVFLGSAVVAGLMGCSSESTTSADNSDPIAVGSSASNPDTPAEEGSSSASGDVTPSSTASSSASKSDAPAVASSSSKKTETKSSEEALNDAQNIVTGACLPVPAEINKGEMATWKFNRSSGDVFDEIMSPFVWNFDGEAVQGNGLKEVNRTYAEAGTYNASLTVDGSTVTCTPLQVQGVAITITSCKADKTTVNAGETVTWTVEATSEATITGYAWTSEFGTVAGVDTKGSLVATKEMHKQNVSATVLVSNNDKTTKSYACEPVTVIDPDMVDVEFVLEKAVDIPTKQTLVAQVPSCADPNNPGGTTACTLVCDTQSLTGETVLVAVDGVECPEKEATYFSCSLKSVAGQKVSINLDSKQSTVSCMVKQY